MNFYKMKPVLSLALILVLFLLSGGCGFDYSDWISVKLNCGTVKVPGSWEIAEKDGLIYFYDSADSKDNILAFQSGSVCAFKNDNTPYYNGDIEENAFANEFQALYLISSSVLSNGATYGEAMVSADGSELEMKYIDFSPDENNTIFYVNTDKVDDDTIINIAASFDSGEI